MGDELDDQNDMIDRINDKAGADNQRVDEVTCYKPLRRVARAAFTNAPCDPKTGAPVARRPFYACKGGAGTVVCVASYRS